MNRAFTAVEIQELRSDTSDPKIQDFANKLATALVEKRGLAEGLAVLAAALTQTFLAVLHVESPMPETNIASIHALIEAMRINVTTHEDCAKRLAAGRAVDDDEPIADVKPTVH